jgi:hypothetical protein
MVRVLPSGVVIASSRAIQANVAGERGAEAHWCILRNVRRCWPFYALCGVLAVSGAALAARAMWGTTAGARSPMNVEGVFALALLAAIFVSASAKERERTPVPFGRPDALLLAGLAGLVAAAYWRVFGFYFLSDEFVMVKLGRLFDFSLRPLFLTPGGDGYFRPVGLWSVGITGWFAGSNPGAWRAFGLALHLANAALVYLLALRTLESRAAAAFAAALFAVHGAAPEAAVWTAGRFDLLATFFTLLGLLLFLRGGAARWLALGCLPLAAWSKESAYVFPLLLLALPRTRWRSTIPFFATAAALFAYRLWLMGGIGGYPGERLAVVSTVKALALRLGAALCFPVNWSVEPGWVYALALAASAAALALLASGRPQRDRLVFPLALLLLPALPAVSQLLIGSDLQKSRLVYLPAAGFCLLLAAAATGLEGRWASIVPAAIVIASVVHLERNLDAWQYAASRTRPACIAASRCMGPGATQLRVAGVPGSLRGVYFFQNGLAECVGMERNNAPVEVEGESGSPVARWDARTDSLYCAGSNATTRESVRNLR